MLNYKTILIILSIVLNQTTATATVLKVAPFPYLPDTVGDQLASLVEFIKTQFEATYPNITLELRPMNNTDGFYNLSTLSNWLASDGSGYDVVEIDTVLLGDLVVAGLLTPQFVLPDHHSDWMPLTTNVVEFNQALYGYPHIMCATFLFTRDDRVADALTIDQLVDALGNTSVENYRLVGNLNSSWDLPVLWLKSYQDSSSVDSDSIAFALHEYEHQSFESLRKLARLCDRTGSSNYCLDGTFQSDPDMAALLFAKQQAKAIFGYSENLVRILKNTSPEDYNNIKIIPIPVGTLQNQPLLTTDAYVFRRNMSVNVLNAARAFVEFMATPRMQAAVVASGDSPHPNTLPRYLLPMSKSAYNESLLANNHFYQRFFRNLTGLACPTAGFMTIRDGLTTVIMKNIQ